MNRADLIAAMQATASPQPISVEVQGWGTLYVRQLTVEEVENAPVQRDADDGKKRNFARTAARLICHENGERIFDPSSEDDVSLLERQPWSMLQRVVAAVDAKGVDPSGN